MKTNSFVLLAVKDSASKKRKIRSSLCSPHDHFNVPMAKPKRTSSSLWLNYKIKDVGVHFAISSFYFPNTLYYPFKFPNLQNFQHSTLKGPINNEQCVVYCSKTETTIVGTTGSYIVWSCIKIKIFSNFSVTVVIK